MNRGCQLIEFERNTQADAPCSLRPAFRFFLFLTDSHSVASTQKVQCVWKRFEGSVSAEVKAAPQSAQGSKRLTQCRRRPCRKWMADHIAGHFGVNTQRPLDSRHCWCVGHHCHETFRIRQRRRTRHNFGQREEGGRWGIYFDPLFFSYRFLSAAL